MNRVALISASLAFGPRSCANTVNATAGGWPPGSTFCFTPVLFPEVLNAMQENSIYHFSSLWYDSTGYRAPTYRWATEPVSMNIEKIYQKTHQKSYPNDWKFQITTRHLPLSFFSFASQLLFPRIFHFTSALQLAVADDVKIKSDFTAGYY